jgi:riboflavin kinase/FMN adenylyltransferase
MVHRDVAGPCLTPAGSVVCIGALDGVHRGHRAVLERVRERADTLRAAPVAVTFAPIPRTYFSRDVPQLTTPREKISLLREAGMQHVLMLRFNAHLAAMTAESFIAQVLVERLAAREVWVGEGFRFGHDRVGDLALLQEIGAEEWMTADVVPPFMLDDERVSSSRIRAALGAGEFSIAERLLGRRFTMGGHVVHGERIGHKLGCPTANLRLGSRIAPLGGVFAVRVHGVGDRPRPGVASLGTRPTINGTEPLLEAHLLDFDGDLYGKRLEVDFVKKIRNEEKYPDLATLAKQISRDVSAARIILGLEERAKAGVAS